MITKTLRRFRLPFLKNSYLFSKISPARFDTIKKHSLHTQYADLNPINTEHNTNKWTIIEDQTKIKFLIEQGGFPSCSDIGILFNAGTQNEDQNTAGSLSALQTLVHIKPDFADSVRNYEFLNKTGSSINFNYDVEHTYLGCSFFQEDSDHIINLMLDLALREKNLFQEVYQTSGARESILEEVKYGAFGGKGIGMPKNGNGKLLSNQNFIQFQKKCLTPHGTVISLSNFNDPRSAIEKIKNKIKQRYPSFLSRPKPTAISSNYRGGIYRIPSQQQWPFFEFGVAFPACQYKSYKMELYNIMRIIIGNASSFSSGGPGKGMHSRCTKNLLNRQACIDSASHILSHYQNFGIFGLSASGYLQDAYDVVRVTLREMSLLKQLISKQEVERAKNILIAGIYMNVEKQSDRLQQLTRNIQCYGKIKLNEYETNIRKVTPADIQQEMTSMFQRTPTFVLKGDNNSRNVCTEGQLKEMLYAKR